VFTSVRTRTNQPKHVRLGILSYSVYLKNVHLLLFGGQNGKSPSTIAMGVKLLHYSTLMFFYMSAWGRNSGSRLGKLEVIEGETICRASAFVEELSHE
jgi:hypothetical protein